MNFLSIHSITVLLLIFSAQYAFSQSNDVQNLSADEKIKGLSTFWSEAKYNFAYFDQISIDWDSAYYAFIPKVLETENNWEYYKKMKEFSALLNDGHTDIYNVALINIQMHAPVKFSRTGATYFVSNIMTEQKLKLSPGAQLIQIDSEKPHEWLQKHIYRYVSASTEHEKMDEAIRYLYFHLGDTTTVLPMVFLNPDGIQINYNYRLRNTQGNWLIKEDTWQRFRFQMLGDIAYVQINTFGTDSVVYDFRKHLPEIRNSVGVILDLRRNGGGNTANGEDILKHFTRADTLFGSAWKTRHHQASFKAWGTYFKQNNPNASANSDSLSPFEMKILHILEGNYWYDGGIRSTINDTSKELADKPLVVLTGNHTASAAEDFLVTLRQLPDRKIPVIGQRSFGSTGQPLPVDLGGGLHARICTKRDTFMDGTDFVGSGIIPDIEIIPTVNQIVQGQDIVMEKAIDLIKAW